MVARYFIQFIDSRNCEAFVGKCFSNADCFHAPIYTSIYCFPILVTPQCMKWKQTRFSPQCMEWNLNETKLVFLLLWKTCFYDWKQTEQNIKMQYAIYCFSHDWKPCIYYFRMTENHMFFYIIYSSNLDWKHTILKPQNMKYFILSYICVIQYSTHVNANLYDLYEHLDFQSWFWIQFSISKYPTNENYYMK